MKIKPTHELDKSNVQDVVEQSITINLSYR